MPTFQPLTEPIKHRGRPKGSTNKPKATSLVSSPVTEDIDSEPESGALLGTVVLSKLEGYIDKLANYIYVLHRQEDGTVTGYSYSNDPDLLFYYKNATQVDIHRAFLSEQSMRNSIGRLGVNFTGGKKYNRVLILDGEVQTAMYPA